MTTLRRPFRRRRQRPSAFAAVTAIVLMGLVATTLAASVMVFAADARRTRAAVAEAQLRQLLIAGAADAQERLGKGETTFDVKLATPADGVVQLWSAPADGDAAVRITVSATLASRRAEQTLHFTRDGDRWKLAAFEPRS